MNAEDYVHLLQEVRRGLRLALKSCGGRIESYLQAAEAEAVRCAAARASGASAGVSASRAASALDLLGGGSASEEEEAAAAWSRGLPKHTCAVDGKGSHRHPQLCSNFELCTAGYAGVCLVCAGVCGVCWCVLL